jgi:hypothetical protein
VHAHAARTIGLQFNDLSMRLAVITTFNCAIHTRKGLFKVKFCHSGEMLFENGDKKKSVYQVL